MPVIIAQKLSLLSLRYIYSLFMICFIARKQRKLYTTAELLAVMQQTKLITFRKLAPYQLSF